MRAAAKSAGVSKSTAERWRRRTGKTPLRQLDFANRSRRPHHTTRTGKALENKILQTREELRKNSALGEYGAQAIQRTLREQGVQALPSVRTIGRILDRRGALDGRHRQRRPPPPAGWYLPPVREGRTELDSFDVIEDLCIEQGPRLDILTAISLHGRLAQAWPVPAQITAKTTLQHLVEHWRQEALPGYAQFDNDTRFQGAHHWPDSISRIMRLCLQLGVIPVFAPPRETGFQASIEHFNRRWQDVVWHRFVHRDIAQVAGQSRKFIEAHRAQHALATEAAPPRQTFPRCFELDLQRPPAGQIIYLRRTDERGRAMLLGQLFAVDRHWPHRLVRAEIDLDRHRIQFLALRRREPEHQPILREVKYQIPVRPFRERG